MRLSDAAADALIEAVRETARIEIMPRFRRLEPGDVETKSGPDDLVTRADRAAEAAIAVSVARILPDALVVGEEGVAANPAALDGIDDAETCVIVDPIDGTANYATGLALFGVILAVVERGETVFGLLYDPVMDDWIRASKGRGARFCRPGEPDLPLGGHAVRPPSDSHGYVSLFLYPSEERDALAATFSRFARVSALRCSCHEYRTMAFGHVQFNLAPSPKPWDHAAGVLVIEECGGAARVAGTRPYRASRQEGPLLVAVHRDALRATEAALAGDDEDPDRR